MPRKVTLSLAFPLGALTLLRRKRFDVSILLPARSLVQTHWWTALIIVSGAADLFWRFVGQICGHVAE